MNNKSVSSAYRAFKTCGGTEKERLLAVSALTGFTPVEIKAIVCLLSAKQGSMPYSGFRNGLPKNGPYFDYSVIVSVDKSRLICALVKYFDPKPLLDKDITLDDVIQLDITYGIPYSEYCDMHEKETSIQDLIDNKKNRIDLPALKSKKIELEPRTAAITATSPEAEEMINELVFYGKTVLSSLMLDSILNLDDFYSVRAVARKFRHVAKRPIELP